MSSQHADTTSMNTVPVARVLAVGGSDPVGGAGIQADLKTITMLGGYGMSAITAVTVQDTSSVAAINPVAPETVAAQMRAVLADIGSDAVKSGMLANAGIVGAVADVLDANFEIPYVLDPVLASTSGERLLADDAVAILKTRLIPRAALLTPNIPEAEFLTGHPIANVDDMRRAAKELLGMGAEAALITGGHLKDVELTDVLLSALGEKLFASERIETRNTRGTGCTLASAIAVGVGQGMNVEDAIARAREFVRAAIEAAPDLGSGNGPLGHSQAGQSSAG